MHPSGTDLLDIFKPRPARGSGGARATSRPVREPRPSGGGSPRRRTLFLGGTVMVLLLALAFTAGVGVGRAKRGGSGEAPPLARPAPTTPRWGLKSKAITPFGVGSENLRETAILELLRRLPQLESYAATTPVLDKTGRVVPGQFYIVLRDFESRNEAMAVRKELESWRLGNVTPFAGSVAEQMR